MSRFSVASIAQLRQGAHRLWSRTARSPAAPSQQAAGMSASERLVVWLMVSVMLLLPFSRLAEAPILVLAVMGLWQLGRSFYWRTLARCVVTGQRVFWTNPAIWVLGVVYLAYLGMVVLSAPDSYWADKSWQVALASLRFGLAAIAVVTTLSHPQAIERWVRLSAAVAAFWTVDALFQYVVGFDLLGRNTDPVRLSGIFGAGHIKMGPVLALLLPFLLAGSRSWPKAVRWPVVLGAFIVIALTGTRSAWLMAAFVALAWWWRYAAVRKWRTLAVIALTGLLLGLALWQFSPGFHQRIERTLAATSGSVHGLDYALADRLPIWQAGWRMFQQHPVNGVGAHAFRKAYPEFAPENNVWQTQGGTAMHAHHWLLEILAETGVLGLMLFIIALVLLVKWLKRCGINDFNWPYWLALLAMFLPIVSTYSIFASFWAICIWWVGTGLLASTQVSCQSLVEQKPTLAYPLKKTGDATRGRSHA